MNEAWKDGLWEELNKLPAQDQFVVAGEWITYITRNLLPALGERRRENVMDLVDSEGSSATTVAGVLGVRRSTLIRLLEEGRSTRKRQRELREELTAAAVPLE